MTIRLTVLVLLALSISTIACGQKRGKGPKPKPVVYTTVTPYQVMTLAPGSKVWIQADAGDPNKGAYTAWTYATSPMNVPVGTYQQAITDDWYGWNDTFQLMGADGLQTYYNNDPSSMRLDTPWFNTSTGTWRPAWVRVWNRFPYGEYKGAVWPTDKGMLTVQADGCEIHFIGRGSPCESLIIKGNDNKVEVDIESGVQSRLIQGRPAVRIEGDRNELYGRVSHPTTAVYVRGNDTYLHDLDAYGGAEGSDIGIIYFANDYKVDGVKQLGHYKGARIENVRITALQRTHPPGWITVGLYFDDKFGYADVSGLTVTGPLKYGLFDHGGDYVRVSMQATGTEQPCLFSAYMGETTAPIGCTLYLEP